MALPERRRDQQQNQTTGGQPDWHAFYDIENPAEVDTYVADRPFLVPTMGEAPSRIAQVFGAGTSLALRIIREPEGGDPYLYLLVQTGRADAYDLLAQLDAAWWLDAALDARTALEIAIQRP